MKTPKEIDDILHNLDRAYLLLSNKNLPDENKESWLKALKPYSTDEILDAIDAHIRGESDSSSQYAPKPKHIIDLISNARGRQRGLTRIEPQEPECDPVVAKAWVIAMNIFHGWAPKDHNPQISLTNDEALEIVNKEAHRFKNPDAIPDQYKLATVWN